MIEKFANLEGRDLNLLGIYSLVNVENYQNTEYTENNIWSWVFLYVPNCQFKCNECNECNELDTNYFFDCFAGFQGMAFFLKRNN